MNTLLQSPLFSLALCIFAFEVGIWIQKRTKVSALNPLLVAIALVVIMIKFLGISLDVFQEAGQMINLFLGPATVVLAIPMYSQRKILTENIVPILVGTAVGALTSLVSVYGLCKLFKIESNLLISLLPKSVTTPIAMEVSEQLGGIVPITVAAVIITGITGAVIAPSLIKIFKIQHPVIRGLAIGASSHAVGTSKAIEIGEIEGAMSGLAIGITGIFTVIFSLFL